MDNYDFHTVAKKSVNGVFALISRTFLIQIIGVLTFFVISAKLDPQIFGIYIVAQSVLLFFNYFQDIGLAASLIQRKEEPSIGAYRSVFTIQQILIIAIISPAIIFSEAIARFYNLNNDGRLLIVALLVTLFLTSLRTIPTVMLERRLDFKKMVIPQIGENIVFNVLLVFLVLSNFGITSFTIAVLARGVTGLILTYIIQPWKIGFAFELKPLKELVSFGLPFQANNILALIKDDLLLIFIGKILPFAQVGFVGFGQKLAFYPLRLIMDNVVRVTFPSYSRLQHDKKALRIAIEKSLFLISFFILPSAVGIIMLTPIFLDLVPAYQKWQPAVLSVIFFSLNTVLSSVSTPLTNFLNAIGKVKITLYFMLFWTTSTWIVTIYLISKIGYNGVAIASFLISLSSIFVFIVVRRYVPYSFFAPMWRQFLASLIMLAFLFFTRGYVVSILTLIIEVALGGLIYILVIFPLARTEIMKTAKFVIAARKS